MPLSGIGVGEMIVIAMLVLIIFGPRRLPEVTRTLGKAVREFKKGMNEIQRELEMADRESRWKAPPPVAPAPSRPSAANPATQASTGAPEAGAPPASPATPVSGESTQTDAFNASPGTPRSPEPSIGAPQPPPAAATAPEARDLPTDDPGPYHVEPPPPVESG